MYDQYAIYQISDAGAISFDEVAYSRFKFGDGKVAADYGAQLFEGFIAQYKNEVLSNDAIVLLPSPYTHIPTASCQMAFFFRKAMNDFLYKNGKKALLESRIHRYKTYSADYGSLSREERLRLIASDTYHVDRDFLQNRLCLFIDDIKITGGHEQVIRQMLDKSNIDGHFIFLYFAELVNPEIPPAIENHLNYFYVQSPEEVIGLLSDDNFLFNTRVVKYILHSSPAAIETYLCQITTGRLQQLVSYAIGNNYHLMEEYRDNLNHIIKHINYGN
jgi:hypothetical protein